MKRNIFLFATLLLVACSLIFTSCNDDPDMDAVPPSFSEVIVSPTSVPAGGSATATLKIKSMGNKWYKLKCTWTLMQHASEDPYIAKGESSYTRKMKEPNFTIAVPDEAPAGTYTLRINKLTVEAASLFANGSLYGSSSIENNSATMAITEAEHPEDESEE